MARFKFNNTKRNPFIAILASSLIMLIALAALSTGASYSKTLINTNPSAGSLPSSLMLSAALQDNVNFKSPVWCETGLIGGGTLQGYIGLGGVIVGLSGNAAARAGVSGSSTRYVIQEIDSPANFLEYTPASGTSAPQFELINRNILRLNPPGIEEPDFSKLTAERNLSASGGSSENPKVISISDTKDNEGYINTLTLSSGQAQNRSFKFTSGKYFIGDITFGTGLGSGAVIDIEGDVELHVMRNFNVSNGVRINAGASSSSANLTIYLYENPNNTATTALTIGNDAVLKGKVFSTDSRTLIDVGNGATFEGGLAIHGRIQIQNQSFVVIDDTSIDVVPGDGPGDGSCISYLEISHAPEALSCTATPVTFRACSTREDCSVLYNDDFDLRVNSTADNSLWLISPESNDKIFRTSASGISTQGLANVPGGPTSIFARYWDGSAWIVIDEDRLVCTEGCEIDFVETGLVVSGSGSPGGYATPISPVAAGVALDSYLWAVRGNPETGACEAELDQVTKPVSFGVECLNPAVCAGDRDFSVADTDVTPVNSGTGPAFATTELFFEGGRTALPNTFYRDVGEYRIHAKLTIVETDPTDEEEDRSIQRALSGVSQPFILYPYALQAVALNSDGSFNEDSSTSFTAAGSMFNVVVRALDSSGAVTPSFGREIPLPQIEFSHEVMWPASGINGTLDGPSASSAYGTPGYMLLEDVRWHEVGVVNLIPNLLNNEYLGIPVSLATSFISEVGHFYPEKLEVVSAQSSISSPCTTFVYMDQPEFQLELEVHALNQLGAITQNYNEDYTGSAALRLVAADIDAALAPGAGDPIDAAENRLSDRLLTLDAADNWVTPEFGTWDNGVLELDLTDLKFERRENFILDGPFNNVFVGVHVESERDNRDFNYGDLTVSEILRYRVLDAADTIEDSVLIGDDLNSIRLFYGRLNLENVFGPETEPLPAMMRVEFWNGSRFAINTADSCTAHNFDDLTVIADPDSINPTKTGSAGDLLDGQLMSGQMVWLNPDGSNTGIFIFEYEAPEWLKFRWDATVDDDVDPRASAEFGRFRSRDRILYWLEQR